jgi:large subunit ribosomal protein L3
MRALIGTKLGMTQIVGPAGQMLPVTIIEAGPCVVTQLKTEDKDGYSAVQLGFGTAKKLTKSLAGHLKPSAKTPRYLREFRTTDISELSLGDELKASIFKEGDSVMVTGTSKGKGFAGTIKRHNFSRGPASHGSRNVRAPGSIGATGPQKVLKGKKMAGQMGNHRSTTKNLEVVHVDEEQNLIAIKGAIPGPKKGLVYISSLAV